MVLETFAIVSQKNVCHNEFSYSNSACSFHSHLLKSVLSLLCSDGAPLTALVPRPFRQNTFSVNKLPYAPFSSRRVSPFGDDM